MNYTEAFSDQDVIVSGMSCISEHLDAVLYVTTEYPNIHKRVTRILTDVRSLWHNLRPTVYGEKGKQG